jgi:fibronectin-binding autotransporter adhesin
MHQPPRPHSANAWLLGTAALILALVSAPSLPAATVITGDVTPALPWTSTTDPRIGDTGAGALIVDGGSQLNSDSSRLAVSAGSTGTATITGVGSKWINSSSLNVGAFGSGAIRVEAGGLVSNTSGSLGNAAGSTGTATVTGVGSTWTNSSALSVGFFGTGALTVEDGGHVSAATLYASLENLHGNGTIAATTGAILDADLQFNAAHPAQAELEFGTGGTLTVTAAGGNLGAGYKALGSLTISEGVVVSSSSGYLGYSLGSTGAATITGVGSTWTNSSALYVGHNGAGTLRVEDGGHVTATTLFASLGDLHGDGTIATTGAILDADLQFNAAHPTQNVFAFDAGGALTVTAGGGGLGAGYKGLGSLTISEGVAISSSRNYLGYHAGSVGTATIIGPASEWDAGTAIYIGYSGSGDLRAEAGGQLTTDSGSYLGYNPGSTGTATVTGADSKWTNGPGSTLYLGHFGSGELRVEAGGVVVSANTYVGVDRNSTGTAKIAGAGSKWTNSSQILVGHDGLGELRVEAGGSVSAFSSAIGHNFGSQGSATIMGAGSTWTSSILEIGRSGNGELRVTSGGKVSNTHGYLGVNSGSTGEATITGAGSKWSVSSILHVGSSGSGSLSISDGALVSVGGTFRIDSNGGNDSFVNMSTSGMLALWGNADDSLAQFLGLVSGTDAIRYWNASLAAWSPLTAATLGVDYTLQFQNTGDLTGYTLLTVLAPGMPGDFNFDNRVDGADLLAWQRGDSPTPLSPDDLATWRANFGLVATTPATTAVPEPGACALAGLALVGLLLTRRAPRRPCC